MKKLTLNQFLSYVKGAPVTHLHDIANIGGYAPTLKLYGEGAFRRAYSVDSLPIVIKFPCIFGQPNVLKGKDYTYCITHTKNEVLAYHTVLADSYYRDLRRFMPKIHYYNFVTGVSIMQRYQILDGPCSEVEAYERQVCELLGQKDEDTDLHWGNWGYETVNRKRRYRIIDMGQLIRIIS